MKKKVYYKLNRYQVTKVEVETAEQEQAVKMLNREMDRFTKSEDTYYEKCSSLDEMYEETGYEPADDNPNPEEQFIESERQAEIKKQVHKALRQLNPRQQANVSGKISDERFAKMTATYEAEQDGLQQTAQRLKDEISAVREEGESVDRFMKLVNKYSNITELNAEIIRTFVEKIIVYEAEKIDGVKMQRVKIVYNCVGAVSVANADNEPVKTDKTKIIEVA